MDAAAVAAAVGEGGAGRAPGCGAGGEEDDCVVVAGMEAGVVRVGGRLIAAESEDAVEGVTPSTFAGVIGIMGASLCMGIGGIVEFE